MSAPRRRRAAVAALLLLALGGSSYVWWAEGGRRLFYPRNFHVVEPGFLYRSGQINRRLIEQVLRGQRIDLVIDLARDRPGDADAEAERDAIARLGIQRLSLPLHGNGRGSPADYAEALAAIASARSDGRHVLVHCTAGAERTGGMIALYRTLFEGWSAEDARAEYERYRKDPDQYSPVLKFVDANVDQIAALLVARGALPEAPSPLPQLSPKSAPR